MYFRRYLLAISISGVFFAASIQDAAAEECKSPDDAERFKVNVDVDAGVPNIQNHRSKAQLGGTNSHGRRRQILGTMQGEVDLRWFINYHIEDFQDGSCYWVASANVELSYHQLDVNIASEYEPGSCQYEAILDHEKEHVVVAQNILSPYAQQIRAALTTLSIPTPDLPAVADSPAEARAQVQAVFRRVLLPVRDQMSRLVRARQADVDTRENYRRTFRQCRRW
ncbi:MAG: hypothetical protein O7A62_07635 [Alphaproteobacteria bacterium]|nr:hypothetical protein [Alphaproteobacteria bacterium]MCZ6590373.1 hypothetical protein [Alphaproteobacteria bacterium]